MNNTGFSCGGALNARQKRLLADARSTYTADVFKAFAERDAAGVADALGLDTVREGDVVAMTAFLRSEANGTLKARGYAETLNIWRGGVVDPSVVESFTLMPGGISLFGKGGVYEVARADVLFDTQGFFGRQGSYDELEVLVHGSSVRSVDLTSGTRAI